MKRPVQDSTHQLPGGRGVVLGEAHPGGKTKQRRRQTEANLEIAENIFSDEAVIALMDEWLVPAIVDRLIRGIMNSVVEDTR